MTSAPEGRIERLVSMSRAVLDRLERGEKLSAILSQGRAVADLYGDPTHVHWLDCEIYGLVDVPLAQAPRRKEHEKAGAYLFCVLHRAADVGQLSIDEVLADWPRDEAPDRSAVLPQSVDHLERAIDDYREPSPADTWAPKADHVLRLGVLHGEHRRILNGVRAYFHQYTNKIWSWAVQERDNLRLLGPDYRLVIDGLDALETGVGQELLAALARLASTNPADRALCALACRNVVLSLGRTLFPVRTGRHQCAMLGKDLDLKGERELNWLTAFIDLRWQKADDETKEKLQELAELAHRVYETGSRGKDKTAVQHGQVQQLVVDTFRLVSGLKEITGLQPLSAAATTGG